MRVQLLFDDHDVAPIVIPRNVQTLRQMLAETGEPVVEDVIHDLDLPTIWQAMAGDDPVLRLAARRILLAGPLTVDQVRYRHEVLRDALANPDAVRRLYELAGEALAAEREIYRGVLEHRGERLVNRSVRVLDMLVDRLRKLRRFSADLAPRFRSHGFTRLFAEIDDQLGEAYLREVERRLADLRFPEGLILSARLGPGNRGTGYVLRRPADRNRTGLFTRSIVKKPSFAFVLPDRDEAGFRALGELHDKGLERVATTVGRAADHVLGYFSALRTELGWYVGALNLYQRLRDLGRPTCLPEPLPPDDTTLEFRDLYDPALALRLDGQVTGNTIGRRDVRLLVVTGANQGGKSTFLRSIGLAHLMLRAGLFVPADTFTAGLATSVLTHFRREEDATMTSGKFDEELQRMSDVIDALSPGAVLLSNESFASTNEREGSQVAAEVIDALRDTGVRTLVVTHLYELAHRYEAEGDPGTLFLRAEPGEGGVRDHRLRPGPPRPTSFAADVYRAVFDPAPAPSPRSAAPVGQFGTHRGDLEQPVVLGHPLPPRRRPGLDLPAPGGHDEVGDERIGCLAGAVRHELAVAGVRADVHRLDRLGDGADLVELDQRGVGDTVVDRLGDDRRVGAEVVVADQLQPIPEFAGELLPAVVVVLTEAIFERPHRVASRSSPGSARSSRRCSATRR